MKVLIISDTNGNDDEGMKKIARKLTLGLNNLADCHAENKRSILSLYHYDIIHFIGGPGIGTLFQALICKIFQKKIIITFSNPFIGNLGLSMLRLINPSLCLSTSSLWNEKLKRNKLTSMFINLSGVDTSRFNIVSETKKRHIRQLLKIPADKVMVLHVGHLKEDRNLALFRLISDKFYKVVIVSKTTLQSAPLEKELRLSGCKIINNYIENIEDYYKASDIYLFPTINEKAAIQIPLSIIEAFTCGNFILSTKFGGLSQVFPHRDTPGFLYFNEKNLISKLSAARTSILSNRRIKRETNDFDWSNICNKVYSCYRIIS